MKRGLSLVLLLLCLLLLTPLLSLAANDQRQSSRKKLPILIAQHTIGTDDSAPCDPTDPSCQPPPNCDPTDPSSSCYCDMWDPNSPCYIGSGEGN
jgi:hypothetical protein